MRTILVLLLAAAVAASAQQVPQGGSQQVFVTAIDVVADVRDAKGAVPQGLTPADFVVLEEGVARTVVGVEYLKAARGGAQVVAVPGEERSGTTWQNVLYFETVLSNGPGRIAAAREMMKHADSLVAMGSVDVIYANPAPTPLLRGSRDAGAVRAALEKIASSSGINQLASQRREYLRDVASINSLQNLKSQTKQQAVVLEYGGKATARQEFDGSATPQIHSIDITKIRPYIDHEINLITNFREGLMSWLSSYRRHVPRNLLLVMDGFDVDPVEFYGAAAPGSTQAELRTYVSQSALGETATRMAQSLSAGSWTTISIPADNNADGWVDDASTSAIGRVQGTMARKPNASPKAFLYRPHDPLNAFADFTGGKVVANSAHLAGILEDLDDRVKITYQVDRKPDGIGRKVDVRAKNAGLKVRAARYASSTTLDDMAKTRAVGLLKSAVYTGDLATEGGIDWAATQTGPKKNGTLRATTNVELVKRLLPAGTKGQFRITLAVQMGKEAVVVNRAVPDYDLTEGVFRFRTPLDLPATANAVVLVIEETTTGVWGSTRVDIAPAATPAS